MLGGVDLKAINEKAAALSERTGLMNISPVLCNLNEKNTILGCIQCHYEMALEAERQGCDVFLSLEHHAEPSARYDIRVIEDAFRFVREGRAPMVSLCIFPVFTVGGIRVQQHSTYVWKKIMASQETTQAQVFNTKFALETASLAASALQESDRAESFGMEWDRVLAKHMDYVTYPAPFRRHNQKASLASTDWNEVFILRWYKNVLYHPFGYSCVEFLQHHFIFVILLAFLLLFVLPYYLLRKVFTQYRA